IDNLVSCHAAGSALVDRVAEGVDPADPIPLVVLFDHEEVGSTSATGAAGPALTTTLERIVASLGGDGSLGPVASALFAVGRVARAEVPSLAWRCIGVPRGTSASWSAVAAELLGPDDELEVRYLDKGAELRRQGRRLVVLDEATGDEPRTERVTTKEVGVVLGIDQVGALGTLHWQRIGRREPGPGEIEIRVEAVGINFKDLLKLTGQLDPRVTRDTFLGDACGMECVGEVVRAGPGVTRMSVGDRVLAAPADGSFRSYVTTSEGTATPAPRSLEPSQAALLLPYLTAWHGLMNVARLGPRDTVLIHAAAGGVGQCAVAIAQRVGARIIATAGSEDKRDHLRGQGIDHVSDSRSLAFVDDVRTWTEGRGVDVVLSALTADGLRESMRLLAPRGRFVDIGKKAFIDNDRLPLRIFNEGLTYASIDMDRMFQDDMPFCLDIVAECVRLIDEGELLPCRLRCSSRAKRSTRSAPWPRGGTSAGWSWRWAIVKSRRGSSPSRSPRSLSPTAATW
ncbi:MAG: zinc-binding dehydrogenase, partial [Polyangiaceae bacterium]